jgi:hypothetical protein
MQCSYCGYILQPFDATCPKCAANARTRQAGAPPPTAGAMHPGVGPAARQEGYKVCPACQQPAVPSMPACQRCGYQYGGQFAASALPPTPYMSSSGYPESSRAAAERHEKRQVAFLASGCLGVLLLIVGAAFFFTSRPYHPSGADGFSVLSARRGGDGAVEIVDSRQMESRLALEAATTGGDLEISLAWNTLSDIDLQVTDPSGEQIAADHPRSVSGGAQDVDANPTLLTAEGESRIAGGQIPGKENISELPELLVDLDKKVGLPAGMQGLNLPSDGVKAPAHWTRQPIEHIYFAAAPKGIYTVRAHCYSWREPDANPLPYTVEIRSHQKVVYRAAGTIGPASFAAEGAGPIEVCRFEHH